MARCSCQGTLPEECNCTVEELPIIGSNVSVGGAGTSVSPYELSPDLAVAPGLLSCAPDGLLGEFPARVLSPPRAKVTTRHDNTVPTGIGGLTVSFNQALYDSDGFFNPFDPTKLTNVLSDEYLFGVGAMASLALPNTTTDDWEIELVVDGGNHSYRSRRIEGGLVNGVTIEDCLGVYEEHLLTPGQFIQLKVRHTHSGSLLLPSKRLYAPVLWITYLSD